MSVSELHNSFAIFLHNIVWLRKHYGISKKRMAKMLGIGLCSLNKLEKGEIPPRMDVHIIFAVSKQFGISPAEQFSVYLQ